MQLTAAAGSGVERRIVVARAGAVVVADSVYRRAYDTVVAGLIHAGGAHRVDGPAHLARAGREVRIVGKDRSHR